MTAREPDIQAILAAALPGERAVASDGTPTRKQVRLAGGESIEIVLGPDALPTAAALQLLRGEFDLPLPLLRAAAVAPPYAIVSALPGEPLAACVGRIAEADLYQLGSRLGEVVYRVHRVAAPHYGELAGEDAAASEREWVERRLGAALDACVARGALRRDGSAVVLASFAQTYAPFGALPALVCGGVAPETVLVRRGADGWSLSGVARWEAALGMCPAWEHALLFDAFDTPAYFALRVGYGNGYDALTERAYEQTREAALHPYRVLLAVRRLRDAAAGDVTRRRRALLALLA